MKCECALPDGTVRLVWMGSKSILHGTDAHSETERPLFSTEQSRASL